MKNACTKTLVNSRICTFIFSYKSISWGLKSKTWNWLKKLSLQIGTVLDVIVAAYPSILMGTLTDRVSHILVCIEGIILPGKPTALFGRL